MADIAAVLHQVPVNRIHELVCLIAGGGDRIAQTHRAQHAAAGGDDLRAFGPSAGMKYFSGQSRGRIEAADRIAFAVGVGVTAGGHDHADGRARIPARFGSIQRPVQRRLAEVDEIALQTHQNRLRLGIAETAVVFEHIGRAIGGDHQTGVQKPKIGIAVGAQSLQRRFDDFAHDARMQRGSDDGRRRVSAHAAGIGAAVAVVAALVVLRRGERQHGVAGRHHDEADFLAVQEFLDHDGAPGAAKAAAQHAGGRRDRRIVRLANEHALARCEPVRLDDHRQPLRADVRRIERVGVEGCVTRGRYAVPLEEILGERLRAFQARCGSRWTEAGAAGGGEPNGDTGDQRALGSHDGEADVFARGECEQAVDIVGGNVDVADLGLECGARVARSHEYLRHSRRLRTLPSQRVFAAAATHDEYFHQCRKWRMPVNTIAMPCSSAAAMTSASRFEPPGWITDLIPSSATASSPSRNGKKASEAMLADCRSRPASSALRAAILLLTTRLICPAPMPTVALSLTQTTAFDLTYFATRHAKIRSSSSARLGMRFVTARSSWARITPLSRVCTSRPPATLLYSSNCVTGTVKSPTSSTRTLSLRASSSRAPWDTLGASITSTNCCSTIACAVAASNSRLKAMTPPYAEVGSVR